MTFALECGTSSVSVAAGSARVGRWTSTLRSDRRDGPLVQPGGCDSPLLVGVTSVHGVRALSQRTDPGARALVANWAERGLEAIRGLDHCLTPGGGGLPTSSPPSSERPADDFWDAHTTGSSSANALNFNCAAMPPPPPPPPPRHLDPFGAHAHLSRRPRWPSSSQPAFTADRRPPQELFGRDYWIGSRHWSRVGISEKFSSMLNVIIIVIRCCPP